MPAVSKVSREFYVANQAYAHELEAIEPAAYERYVDALAASAARGRVLDVGCGTGTAVGMLRARGCDAHGCDVSPEFIGRAAARTGDGFALIGADGALPYADASFDAVGSCNVLEHVETPSAFLDELNRVLRPGGSLVLATPNMLSLTWPRPRLGIANLWRIRMLNAMLLARRALAARPTHEFVTIECRLDMADFQPDYDAICLTNYFDVRRALLARDLSLRSFTATQRVHRGIGGHLLDAVFASPLGWLLGAVFVVACKPMAAAHGPRSA
ncbi:MAG: class I SAM-dependent methyltransferase [Candidatus Eremiobacteraeota bacterium]|nr:class I SAM-dependent methyltransferase [Candidatus Eremiobacteraeota bacterium]